VRAENRKSPDPVVSVAPGLPQPCSRGGGISAAEIIQAPEHLRNGCSLPLLQLTQQARQLDDVDSDAPRFLARQPLGDTAPAGLIVEIEIGERLAGRVYPDSKCGGRIMPTSEDYWRRADEARLLTRQTKDLRGNRGPE
jgi:hypothetical protein